ncbi:N-acetylglucosamine-6-phosphate deacetylase [Haploplasma axanthum]|uniref:N-acetylglucosamine-6-phosphate deacetylase n=1 Tax=Haploplasma axanthum TaxID=29552 RepID=A0A449BDC8_HAPAX|nr:N-acetylglucosamine-6-phosphate deacetylase [Haploplasma axanthum]VEU80310.1 N-acetylglucosamine-6-phosphate deacetylase [Haploplasma axanthum]
MNFKKINIVFQNEILMTSLKIKDGKIESIGKTCNLDGYELEDYYLVPGFIDQHIHGAAGYDFMDATNEALEKISTALLAEGTTSFLGTTMTQSIDNIDKSVKNLVPKKLSGANLLGVHLEGPFINEVFKGAQPFEYIIPANLDIFKKWNSNYNIKLVSLAPEKDKDHEFIKYCRNSNIIASIAHTNATHEEVQNALNDGVKGFTHAFNAMSRLHHRDINVVGSMLLYDDYYAEVICDGIHVSREAVKLLYKQKGREKMILITDSMRAKYLPDGKSELGGQTVFVNGMEARLEDGTLAGSILKMNDAVKNVIKFANVDLIDAIYMASTSPARNLGLKNKGYISELMDADLVILDKNLDVYMTIVGGVIKYER